MNLTEHVNISTIELTRELLWIADKLEDPDLEKALKYVVAIIQKPDVSVSTVGTAIVKLSALAAKFSFAATYYKTYGSTGTGEAGKPGRWKKDMYYTASDAIPKLVDALKYIVRVNEMSQ